MNEKQKESIAKYLYDISKGVALATIAGMVTDQMGLFIAAYCFFTSIVILACAYIIEED